MLFSHQMGHGFFQSIDGQFERRIDAIQAQVDSIVRENYPKIRLPLIIIYSFVPFLGKIFCMISSTTV